MKIKSKLKLIIINLCHSFLKDGLKQLIGTIAVDFFFLFFLNRAQVIHIYKVVHIPHHLKYKQYGSPISDPLTILQSKLKFL